jgi:phosphoserine phosphatase RsbU/P
MKTERAAAYVHAVDSARAEAEAARAEEKETHVEAERTNAQLQSLQALTDTALSHLALGDLLNELLGRVTSVIGVDHVSILLLDEDGKTLIVRAASGLLIENVGQVQIPMGQAFAGRIAASRKPLIVDDLSAFEAGSPRLREHLHSVAGVPLLVEDEGGNTW